MVYGEHGDGALGWRVGEENRELVRRRRRGDTAAARRSKGGTLDVASASAVAAPTVDAALPAE